VKLSSADELILGANNLKENYLLETQDPDVVETLDNTRMPKKAI
jgi:hypothetical protein